MDLSEFCEGNVVTIEEGATLKHAARMMQDFSVGALVVTASGTRRPVGLITDRDIVTNALTESADLGAYTAGSILSGQLMTIYRSQTWQDALRVMTERRMRRLVIIDDSLSVCGFVSIDDLVEKMAIEARELSQQLESLSSLIRMQVGTVSRHRTHEFTQMA